MFTSPAKNNSPAKAEKTPVPRAARLNLQTPVRYRAKGLGKWHKGVVQNLSQSGVVLLGSQHLPGYTLVEMVFEMLEEVSGQKNRTVLCQGRIVRRNEVEEGDSIGLAASILDYTFLSQNHRLQQG